MSISSHIGTPWVEFTAHLCLITSLQNACSSLLYLYSYFINKLLCCALRCLMPKPPALYSTLLYELTSLYPLPSLQTDHENLLLSLSNFFITLKGKGNRDIAYVWSASSTKLIRMSLPPNDMSCAFHLASLFSVKLQPKFHCFVFTIKRNTKVHSRHNFSFASKMMTRFWMFGTSFANQKKLQK